MCIAHGDISNTTFCRIEKLKKTQEVDGTELQSTAKGFTAVYSKEVETSLQQSRGKWSTADYSSLQQSVAKG